MMPKKGRYITPFDAENASHIMSLADDVRSVTKGLVTMTRQCNSARVQEKIEALVESCRTERGGFTKVFFQFFELEPSPGGNHWTPAAGWRKRLVRYGDLETIRANAGKYHARERKPMPVAPAAPPPPRARTSHEIGQSAAATGRIMKRLALLEARVTTLERISG